METKKDKGRKFFIAKALLVLLFLDSALAPVLLAFDKDIQYLVVVMPVIAGGLISYMLANAYLGRKENEK